MLGSLFHDAFIRTAVPINWNKIISFNYVTLMISKDTLHEMLSVCFSIMTRRRSTGTRRRDMLTTNQGIGMKNKDSKLLQVL